MNESLKVIIPIVVVILILGIFTTMYNKDTDTSTSQQ